MTRSRGNSRAPLMRARNVARVVVAGAVVAGPPLALAGTANAASDDVWDRVAQCESGGHWNTNTGNGYSGGLQFTQSTWRAHGGQGSPAGASRAEQIAVAERVLASQGWSAWPACSKKVGATGGPTPRPLPVRPAPSLRQTSRTAVKPLPHTVAPGKRLSKIAPKKHTSGGTQTLHRRNKGKVGNPSSLKVGQRLGTG